MQKTDVLIIGGSAAGIVAATTGKSFYPDKNFLLLRMEEEVLVPCGIPYIFGSLGSSEKNLVSDAMFTKLGIKLKIDEAVSIDQEKKICKTSDGTEIEFDKLVLATGSIPSIPKWLIGTDMENVFTIPKDKNYLDGLLTQIKKCNRVVIIGGGFIGVELADELKKVINNVTLVEVLPHILQLAFDDELALRAEEILKERGVQIITNNGVKEIQGAGKVTGVLLNNGEKIETDIVILSTGYHPNSALAEKSGIEINELGFIKVNAYMNTANKDIFAIGDCAEKHSFITSSIKSLMLASTACSEARIVGMNLFGLSTLRSFKGTISIFCTSIGDTGFGVAGVTETLANQRGFNVVTGTFEGIDKHPGTMEGTKKQLVKLIVTHEDGIIIGGEVIGASSTGELTNLIGLAIENQMTVNAILTSQIGTHPLLTGPPTAYPVIKAAEMVVKQRRKEML
ncbi:MAG: FAD-dependent oxidoreductase [Bacteroidales bacterium]|nr:FAD-dependent oxidoreductase [Bacteroidales bacterium]